MLTFPSTLNCKNASRAFLNGELENGFVCIVDESGSGRFCCKSQLRQAAKRDSVVLTRFSARSIHDGPSEE